MNNGNQMIQLAQNINLLKEVVDIMMQTQAMLEERLVQIDESIVSLKEDINNRPITVSVMPTPAPAVHPVYGSSQTEPTVIVDRPASTIHKSSTKLTGDDETFIPIPDTSDIKVTTKKKTVKKKIKKDFSKKAASLSKED